MRTVKSPKHVIAICVLNERRYGHDFTVVRVVAGKLVKVLDRYDGAKTNSDGYGSPDAADAVAAQMLALHEDSYVDLFEPCWAGEGISFSVDYQHFQPADGAMTYCSPRIDAGDAARTIVANVATLKRLSGKDGYRFPRSPEALIAAFKRHVRIEVAPQGRYVRVPTLDERAPRRGAAAE